MIPGVERLIHHQHSQPVARCQKRRRGRVVTCANGVETRRFQEFDAPLFGAVGSRASQQPVVVMHAAAAQLNRRSVQHKSARRIEGKGANAKRRHALRSAANARAHTANQAIQSRMVRRPQLRIGHADLRFHRAIARRREGLSSLARRHRFTARVNDSRCDRDRAPRQTVVAKRRPHAHRRGVRLHAGRGDIGAVFGEMDQRRARQTDVAIDARTRIPTRSQSRTIGAHRQDIGLSNAHEGRQIVRKTRVTVAMNAQLLAVEPHG